MGLGAAVLKRDFVSMIIEEVFEALAKGGCRSNLAALENYA
jgi:hypothetical protein